ncbi:MULTISPECIES: hypothetical protein [Rhizobium/Agrobacterium group]|uniref:hypothetical protein n=1 Tax=Rhizobium/Agrobacterium group TaxID=227290 RepID=UPI0004DAC361|nr:MULTISPECIES: hypothetical protein [Rhizobium/Agrobacterium group]KEA04459.1 hypothetical protein CN09_19150 [Rhizobium rhizogenes]NMV72358.1 hypothetical protein [Agrobacterium fabrum]NTF72643.1 hypothetical protein [Rhizobium rhizogenes]NTI85356.1 hypothetical protein [Rhizobium rhizogenes]NTJ27539.1 hypothetical protein [Rhizobium rhizogenes]
MIDIDHAQNGFLHVFIEILRFLRIPVINRGGTPIKIPTALSGFGFEIFVRHQRNTQRFGRDGNIFRDAATQSTIAGL